MSDTIWVLACKRTDDPKLAWIEAQLQARGIPSRRHGFSFHAPCLYVPAEHEAAFWAFMAEPFDGENDGQTVDDVDDDDPAFYEEGPDPIRDGWIGSDGRP